MGFWFVVGVVLLWFVYKRRSAGARRVVIFLALVGAAIFGTDAVSNSSSVLLALAYVGQAIPLMFAPVRRHVAAERD
ncbi:MAG: hypothetical protein ABIR57_11525 [Aeromicrobium sp.]